MDETLLRALKLRALELNGYRKHHKLPFDPVSDDALLERKHAQRGKSEYQPSKVRPE